jgi:hypothetical protein
MMCHWRRPAGGAAQTILQTDEAYAEQGPEGPPHPIQGPTHDDIDLATSRRRQQLIQGRDVTPGFADPLIGQLLPFPASCEGIPAKFSQLIVTGLARAETRALSAARISATSGSQNRPSWQ